MDRKTIIERAIEECVNEMYLAAQPSTTLEYLKQNCKGVDNWYDNFYLNQKEA